MDVTSVLSAARLVPVVVLDDAADADVLAGALVAGGLPVAEVTFRTAAAADSIRAVSAREDILVGAGTVLTVAQVDQAVAAGASFVVSPGVCPGPSSNAATRRVCWRFRARSPRPRSRLRSSSASLP